MAQQNLTPLPSWVHIGVAKGASSSLQREYFSKHPELISLGIGALDTNTSWTSQRIQVALEVDLRCRAEHVYSDHSVFNTYWKEAYRLWNDKAKRIGFSYENLTCSLGHDVGIVEKAKRLRRLLGSDVKIVYVIREQQDLLISLYKELLLWGVTVSFENFVERLVFTDFQGIFADLQYAQIVDTYVNLFGRDNVLLVPFKQIVQDSSTVLDTISNFLGVQCLSSPLSKTHAGLTAIQSQWLLSRNREEVHDFGRDRFAIWHGQRLQEYANNRWNGWLPDEIHENMKMGVQAARIAREVKRGVAMSFTLPKALRQKIDSCFKEGNQQLFNRYGIDLERL